MSFFSSWDCEFCDTRNTFRQKYCGEGTVNGCGAKRGEADKLRNVVGWTIDDGPVYYGDPRLPNLRMRPDFVEALMV